MAIVGQDDNEKQQPQWKTDLLKHVEKFNRNHACVLMGGKHRVMRIVPTDHSKNDRETLEFFSQKELEAMYQHSRIKTGEKPSTSYGMIEKFDNLIAAWAKHYNCRVFKGGVIFKPNAPPSDHQYMARLFCRTQTGKKH